MFLNAELLTPLMQSPMMARLGRIAGLPYLAGPIELHADASPKPFGFPAGIVVRTQPDWLYPLSAPDMGCGYLVVDSGIEASPGEIERRVSADSFREIVDMVALRATNRPAVATSVDDVLALGVSAVGDPKHFATGPAPAEESNSWQADFSVLPLEFRSGALQASLGSAAGHFVACYLTEHRYAPHAPAQGRLIVVVHVGAAPVRDYLNKSGFYVGLAETAVESGVSSTEDAADGLFAVDLRTQAGRQFLGAAMASRNFGYANRQVVADRVIEILRRRLASRVVADAVQLRHVDHVAYEADEGAIRSRRGLQPLHPTRPVFVTGGEHTHAYLCATAPNGSVAGGLCCHGSPVRDSPGPWPTREVEGLPDILGWAQGMESNTALEESAFWAGTLGVEQVVGYLRAAGIAEPLARLRPFANYREAHL